MRDRQWDYHRPSCIIICKVGALCDVEEARRAVGHSCHSGGAGDDVAGGKWVVGT